MKRTAVIIGLCFFSVASLYPQRSIDEKTVLELKNRSDQFIGKIYETDYQGAFEYARTFPLAISPERIATLEETVQSQLSGILEIYGKILQAQYIGYNALSDFLLRFIYVVRFERHFIWWQLVYYRGEFDWQLSSIKYNDDTDTLMDITFR